MRRLFSLSLCPPCLGNPSIAGSLGPRITRANDPERGKVRGTIKLGETVIIDLPVTQATGLKPGVVPDPNVTPPRGSRPGGPFEIEGSSRATGLRSKSSMSFPDRMVQQ